MALSMWMNDLTGERLDEQELAELRRCARVAYAANPHIFEDEWEALSALGAVPADHTAAAAAPAPSVRRAALALAGR